MKQHQNAQNRLAPPQTQLEDSDRLSDIDIGGGDLVTLPTLYPSPQPQTFTDHPLQDPTAPFSNITMGGVEQKWSSEQIADFVRKLGFLDAEKEGGDKIKLFLHLNSVSYCDPFSSTLSLPHLYTPFSLSCLLHFPPVYTPLSLSLSSSFLTDC